MGKGLALALADHDLRIRLLEDMRDSPFPVHSLPLQPYLHGEDGSRIARATARRLDMDPDEFGALLESAPPLQVYMPSSHQQATWTGRDPVTVVATDAPREDRASMRSAQAWTAAGERTSVPLYEPPEHVIVAVVPAEHDFGDDPEAKRRASPERERRTVKRQGFVPRSVSHRASGGQNLIVGGGGTGDPGSLPGYEPGGGHVSTDVTWSQCMGVASSDADRDGIRDSCEQELARAFRPVLRFDLGEDLKARESYWAATPTFNVPQISIFYALAYHDDGTHVGDSEFIWLTVEFDTGRWMLTSATYSAHWRSLRDRTKTYAPSDLEWPDRIRGKPYAYASENKHANYNTDSECDTFVIEDCGRAFTEAVEAPGSRNLGEWKGLRLGSNVGKGVALADCVPSSSGSTAPDGHSLGGTECFWSGESFDGWHNSSDGVTPYRESLDHWYWWIEWEFEDGGFSGGTLPGDDDDPTSPTI